jgi:hypothetical protein
MFYILFLSIGWSGCKRFCFVHQLQRLHELGCNCLFSLPLIRQLTEVFLGRGASVEQIWFFPLPPKGGLSTMICICFLFLFRGVTGFFIKTFRVLETPEG